MSTYAQVSDVKALAPNIAINANTTPNEGQVQAFLDKVEAELNAIFGTIGFDPVPIAAEATESRILLKDLTAHGALAHLLRARAFGTDSSLLDAATAAQRYYDSRIKALKDPDDPFTLPDATQSNGILKSPIDRSGSFADEGYSDFEVDAPRITRAQVF
jgi:hypothetical protein